MIPLALAFVAALSAAPAVDPDTITPADALALDGRVVVAEVTACVPNTTGWWSVAGNDLGERTRAVVVPRDWRVRSGEVVRAAGVLETIRHPAAVAGGVSVPGWDEAWCG